MNTKGLTLLELSIVMVLLSVLGVIGVVNFSHFQVKSYRIDAKNSMSDYYAASKLAFSEHGFFPGNFVAIKFNPVGDKLYRITASNNLSRIKSDIGDSKCISTNVVCAWPEKETSLWREKKYHEDLKPIPATSKVFTKDEFFLVATSALIDTGKPDEWTINEKKEIKNFRVGWP